MFQKLSLFKANFDYKKRYIKNNNMYKSLKSNYLTRLTNQLDVKYL